PSPSPRTSRRPSRPPVTAAGALSEACAPPRNCIQFARGAGPQRWSPADSQAGEEMLAARLHGNRDLRVEQMPEPEGVPGGQVRVRPEWCGICGTDLHEYAHGPLYTPAENLPQVIGHEFSAVVTEVGDGVTNVQVGDRVAVLPHVFCGSCYFCVRGRQGLCRSLQLTGVTWPWGGLAEQAVVPSYQAIPLPDEVSFEQGAILEPLASVVHAVERSGLKPGGSVLITGAGPIGQLAVLTCA